MDCPGKELLARTRLAGDEHSQLRWGGLQQQLHSTAERWRASHNAVAPLQQLKLRLAGFYGCRVRHSAQPPS
jgi:hypothetical protein